jgi:PAS domain S-box-containing protein
MDDRKIQRAWEKFIENGAASNAVRGVVAASWERSQGYLIPIERSETRVAPEAELVHRRSEHSELLAAAQPALEQARVLLAEASSMVIVTDPSGVVIETAGDPRTIAVARMIHLQQGGHWAEVDIGTNAIGTAIAALQPVQIHGVEHFCSEVQRWTCAATPIWHPTDGELLGILDISGSAKTFNPQSLAFACAVGRQIESTLAQSIKDDHERLLRYFVDKRAHWLTEDVVAIDRRGMIVYATRSALRVVERRSEGLISDGRISSLNKVPILAWPARLSQLAPNVSTELVVDHHRAIGIILVLHRPRRKSVPTITPEELQAALAREQEIDLSERKRGEEALRRSEAYLAQAQRLSQTGSFWWRVSSGELIWSDEAFRVMGYDRTVRPSVELFLKRVHPEDIRMVQHMVRRAAREGMNMDFEHRLLMPDGSVKHVHVLVETVCLDPENRELVGTVMDITARKQAEEAVSKAQSELAHVTRITTLGELTASIAHEVNQPLAAVVTNANASLRWLSGDSPNLAEAREAIRRIIRDGNRGGEIIGRIRALAKKAPPKKDWLDLNETMGEVIAMARSEVQRNGVLLQTKLANNLPLILGDKIQLQQVILNLLMNAVEAMSGSGEGPRELGVNSEKVADIHGELKEERYENRDLTDTEWTHVLITVRDSGPGLDPRSLNRLFDPFYTTKPQGMGMGLAISRSIVEAHGGRLWAKASEPRGGVFQFTLPIRHDTILI